MKPILFVSFLLHFLALLSHATPDHDADSGSSGTSIVFTTLGRLDYAFDIFSLPIQNPPSETRETKITDGQSVNFNGHFPSPSSTSLLRNRTLIRTVGGRPDPSPLQLIYVTERDGLSNIYYDEVYSDDLSPQIAGKRSALEVRNRVQIPLLDLKQSEHRVSMKDKPSLTGDYLVYVSTHEESGKARTSTAAVYSTELKSGVTRRLTPYGVADYSPSVSPSGDWTAVASYGPKGWQGEVEELSTDIYVFLTRDGTKRVKVVEHGGWPAWGDERTLYFHRRGEDKWWSIYRAILPKNGPISTESVVVERVTQPGLHVFTPATSPGNKKFIAVATRRPTSRFRHIELFDIKANEFKELTRLVSPKSHHLNPFISPDATRVGTFQAQFRRSLSSESTVPSRVSHPAGDRIAYVDFPGVYIIDPDGQNRRQVYEATAFSTSWDPVRKGFIYTSAGPKFATVSTEVDIISIDINDVDQPGVKKLTTNGKNNAFPSASPDGKWIVFRSGRTGYKNLYIMDAENGEKSGLRRLTEGPWSDTMCNWSPDGEWIVFASDRDDRPYGEIFTVKLDGSELRRLTHNSYEDGTPCWVPKHIKAVDVVWPEDKPLCEFEDLHWLNEMPSQLFGAKARFPNMTHQCGVSF
ncbi:hypothetical protein FEM48_Zijuj06G0130500 [Ziziphus jujuba var. spinosa]|uniref:Uncharacterized protein n=1 Tax=Ziziphus jujuba var. spinosa TaxID=714518 RepID=A0A978V9F7_ZIZJJ|nr:hypothetical protein FEM48_Zijuj06G0130500 [Ziziphus jujuba var. spinosa]